MHYVKHFDINGVATKQVACIELHGKPNGATEGFIGLLGIDMDSPTHDVYKCVEVKGSIYTWELLSSGMSILSAVVSGKGEGNVTFPYADLQMPDMYLVKIGDLIFDAQGYLYRVASIGATSCDAAYTGTQIVGYGENAYEVAVGNGYGGSEQEWLESLKGVSVTNITITEVDSTGSKLTLEYPREYIDWVTITIEFLDGSTMKVENYWESQTDLVYEDVVGLNIKVNDAKYVLVTGTGDIRKRLVPPYRTWSVPITRDSVITSITEGEAPVTTEVIE